MAHRTVRGANWIIGVQLALSRLFSLRRSIEQREQMPVTATVNQIPARSALSNQLEPSKPRYLSSSAGWSGATTR